MIYRLLKFTNIFLILFVFFSVRIFAQNQDQKIQVQTTQTENIADGDCEMRTESGVLKGTITNGVCLLPNERENIIRNENTSNNSCSDNRIICNKNISNILADNFNINLNPEVMAAVTTVSNAVQIAGTVATVITLVSPLLFLSQSPQLYFSGLFILFGKRKSSPWGLVYDEQTKNPIPFAVISLIRAEDNIQVKDTVSDFKGRFTFSADKGIYYLDVKAEGYFPTTKKDGFIDSDIYTGEKFNLLEDNTGIAAKVPLEKISTKTSFLKKFILYFRKNSPSLFRSIVFISLLFSVIAFFFITTWLNFAAVVIYALLYAYLSWNKYLYSRSNGYVYNAETKLPLKAAFVSLIDRETDKLAFDLILSDEKGRFDFIVPNGEYILDVRINDFKIKEAQFQNTMIDDNRLEFYYSKSRPVKVGLS